MFFSNNSFDLNEKVKIETKSLLSLNPVNSDSDKKEVKLKHV